MDIFKTKKAAIGTSVIGLGALIVAPAVTLGVAAGAALGLSGGVLYSKDKPTGGGIYIAAATFTGGLIGGMAVGITSEFTDVAQADLSFEKQAHYAQGQTTSLEDIMSGAIKDEAGQSVYFTIAPSVG